MEKKLKVAVLLTTTYLTSYGGIGPFVRNLDVDLKKHFDLQYFFLPEKYEKIRLIPQRMLYVLYLFWNYSKIKKVDLFISHSPEGSLVAQYTGIPLVHIFHGNTNPLAISRFWYGKYLTGIFDRIHKIVIDKAFLIYTVGEAREGARKFVNPITHEVKVKDSLERSGFVYAGRLEKAKCVDRIILAYNELPASLRKMHKLYIAGRGTVSESLRQLVSKLQLDEEVVFTGNLENRQLIDMISRRKILLMASEYEGFPMCIAESFSVGVPVITTAVGDIPQFVKDGVNGLLFKVGFDNAAYAKGIQNVLDGYPEFRKNAEETGHLFDAGKITEGFVNEIYQSMGNPALPVISS